MMAQSKRGWNWKLRLASSLVIGGVIFSFENFAFAQIIPDTTLGTERSVIRPLNRLVDQIDGGAVRGANLFHSFQEFNFSEGRGVYFTNPAGIENIFSRVTGGNPSNILGKLGVLGNANLFLINPNGIIFGSQASLDVGGSFLATTANAIQFGNQGFFYASEPNVPPVLTVNPSALLFNQIVAGSITNKSREPAGQRLDPSAPSKVRSLFGLRVPDKRSLLLVGGNVNLNGGGLTALGGQVELTGVGSSGMVGLEVNGSHLSLSFPDGVTRADISLTNGARVDTSGEGSGNIQMQGKDITLSSGSQIVTDTLGARPGRGSILNASDSVHLSGRTRDGILSSRTLGAGNSGDLTINTKKFIVQGGAQVLTSTNSTGLGGNLTVNASESVELIGTSPGGAPSSLASATFAAGNAGDLTINTGKLIVKEGAEISTVSSGVEDTSGNFTPATGKGGDLIVNASDSLEVIGTDKDGFPSGLFASTQDAGNAGDLKIATAQLLVQDGAEVSVSSEGIGNAGDIEVTAGSIRLENGGKLKATSALGKSGGNITLKDLKLLLLRGNSEIATDATGGNGNGGNINIDTDLLVGVENSDITATAIRGQGGNIKINTQGIFGIEPRSERTPESDITASSELGVDGVVEINRPEADPSAELVVLPTDIVDVSGLIAQGCSANGGNMARGLGEFIVTGRGGLPPNPSEALRSETALADLGKPVQGEENRASAATANNPTSSSPVSLVEAQGLVIGSKGEVFLTAQAPTVTPHIPWLTPTTCHGS